MSKIGKIRARLNIADMAIKACNKPYPLNIVALAQIHSKIWHLDRVPVEAFNDDGTIKPVIKDNEKPIAYSSSCVYSDEPIKITSIEDARKISDRVMQATITSTLNIGDEE